MISWFRASLHVRIATMMNLDFPDGTSPPSHIPRSRKSPRKNASKPSPPPPPPPPEPATEHVTNKKKKKKKALASSSRIWNEEDELTVLKGLVEYQAQKGNEPKSNWGDFYRFVGGSITGKFSKEQVLTKIRKLKAKFIANMQKANTSKSEAFLLSKSIWGPQSESDQSADHTKSGEEMANHEPSNNEVTKADFEGNEESWVVRDAFETMVSKGLSDYQKKLQLEKLMNLGSGKRRELSDEWKELCAEEVKLNIKKFKFSAMLAEAAKW
ncbi:GLABROUS1 enhancer-binding protein-like isoform X1 [Brassica napus]|uniref:GLABROUS1 enhancer-binding protein-like isoform X1 n=1 Tax=Brassica napus TaxID=3708 RepID=UPI002078AAD0|nr:GLABROUS1 enhancer-binding protein-like isoform X1 [Brassica napus]